MKAAIVVAIVVVVGGGVFAFRPVCVPITDEGLAQFNSPIEERTDRDFYVKVFQQRDGRWYHCKTWISRQFFF